MELSLSVFTTYVCRGWDSNTQPSACEVNALTHCATVAVIPKHFITLLQSTLWLKQHLWQLKKGQLIKTLGSVFIENAALLYRQLLDRSTGHDDIVGINETFIMIQIVVSKSVRIRIMKLRSDGKKEHWKKICSKQNLFKRWSVRIIGIRITETPLFDFNTFFFSLYAIDKNKSYNKLSYQIQCLILLTNAVYVVRLRQSLAKYNDKISSEYVIKHFPIFFFLEMILIQLVAPRLGERNTHLVR